jgi:hypothetical protein
MVIAHYGYLVLKMMSPNGILRIHRERDASVSALEKIQTLATRREATAGPGSRHQEPLSSRQCASSSAPHVQPSGSEDIPVKTIQIRADTAQTICITGDLDSK